MRSEQHIPSAELQSFIAKLNALPRPGQLAVEHFIDYLYARYQHKDTLTEDFFSLSAEAWDND